MLQDDRHLSAGGTISWRRCWSCYQKGRPELVSKFNEAIKEIRINGKYKEINDKYFDFDAFGYDG